MLMEVATNLLTQYLSRSIIDGGFVGRDVRGGCLYKTQ